MTRRIITNLILAFALNSLIISIRHYVSIEILKDNSFFTGSWIDYASAYFVQIFLITPAVFLVFILLPYNLIIVKANPKVLSLFKKSVVFLLLLIVAMCLIGSFINIWRIPYWKNLYILAFLVPYSLIFPAILHYLVDTKEKIYWFENNTQICRSCSGNSRLRCLSGLTVYNKISIPVANLLAKRSELLVKLKL